MPGQGLTAPLRRPLFRRLAVTYAINELGDWMGLIALSVLVYDQTESALATAALFIGTGFLPALLAPALVARVELPSPRFALPVLYAAEAAAFGGLALLSVNFSLAGVILLGAVDGTLMLAARALTRSVAASLLEPVGELRAGNAILNVAFTGGAAVGPAIAGLVVAGFGIPTALLLDAVSFYAIGWILLMAGAMPRAEPEPGHMRARLKAGIAYIREQTTLRRLLIAEGLAFVFFAAVIPVEVVYVKDTLNSTDTGYGLMLASWGAGMVLGSLLFARLRQSSLGYLLLFSTFAVGSGYLGLAAAPTLAFACLASVVGGTGNGVQWVTMISAVQELTAESMQARVMSVLESIGAAMPGVGFALGGVIAALVSPRMTFLVAGAGVMAIVVVMTPLLKGKWMESGEVSETPPLDGRDDVVVELLPGTKNRA
ncbi:MAG TPA: MFS transporter [Solirubrobacterales bacterium]|nr:MFS transporter [Solirubrobacterales bacterium]